MFRKLKIRFILLASAAIVCILLTMIAVLNSVRFLQTNGEIQAVLNILSANNGDFPSVEETAESLQNDRITIDTINNTAISAWSITKTKHFTPPT